MCVDPNLRKRFADCRVPDPVVTVNVGVEHGDDRLGGVVLYLFYYQKFGSLATGAIYDDNACLRQYNPGIADHPRIISVGHGLNAVQYIYSLTNPC